MYLVIHQREAGASPGEPGPTNTALRSAACSHKLKTHFFVAQVHVRDGVLLHNKELHHTFNNQK